MDLSLIQLGDQITIIIVPVIIAVGLIGNSLNIVVLTRSSLYQQACSRYFIANAAGNLFFSSIILLYRLLADQYQIDPAKTSDPWCKIIVYINHMGIFLAPNFIVLASIDRWCASSTNPRLRKFSSVKIARLMILLTVLIFALVFCNSAILADLQFTDFFGCRIRADTIYKQIYVFVQASMVSIIAPCLMAVFGLMTIYNIKVARVRPLAVTSDRRTENQLARMLFLQVGIHIVLNVPSSITYLMFVLPNDVKTTPGFFFASLLSVLPFDVSYVTPFFLYVLSAQSYRKELFRILKRISRLRGTTQVHPVNTANKIAPMASLRSSVKPRHN